MRHGSFVTRSVGLDESQNRFANLGPKAKPSGEGPRNVPDYSVYEYPVEAGASRANTQWVAPGFGQQREADPTPGNGVDSVHIFWDQSPKIAKARYQATTDYVWANRR